MEKYELKKLSQIKSSLSKFNESDIRTELNTVKRCADLSNTMLMPEEFYKISDYDYINYNLGSGYDKYINDLVNLINSLQKTINDIEEADSSSTIKSEVLGVADLTGVVSQHLKGENQKIENVNSTSEYSISGNTTSNNSESINNFDTTNVTQSNVNINNNQNQINEEFNDNNNQTNEQSIHNEDNIISETSQYQGTNNNYESSNNTYDINSNDNIIKSGILVGAGLTGVVSQHLKGENQKIERVNSTSKYSTNNNTISNNSESINNFDATNVNQSNININNSQSQINEEFIDNNNQTNEQSIHQEDSIISETSQYQGTNNNYESSNNTYDINSNDNITIENNEVTIGKKKYSIIGKQVNQNGEVVAVAIDMDGQIIWLYINSDGTGVIDSNYNSTIVIKELIELVVASQMITINPGSYEVIEYQRDVNGKIVSIAIKVNNQIIWLPVVNGQLVIPKKANQTTFHISDSIVLNINGQKVEITPGDYSVLDYLYDESGNVVAVLISKDKYKIWLHLNSSGNIIKVEYMLNQHGVFTIVSSNFDIYDKYGNVLGKFKEGQYYIYDVLYDENGNVIALKLSSDDKYELWLYPNGNNSDGMYSLFDTPTPTTKGSNLALFKDKKLLYGLLGVLFVGAGVTYIMKKKKKNNINDEEWEEEEISTGSYPVYDVKANDDGLVTDARVTPIDSADEYWVEV